VAIIRCGKKIRKTKMNNNWNRTNYTDKNSKGQGRLKREAGLASIGIYFFLVVLAVTFTLALIR
jgi:hypothetical protein